MYFRKSRGNRPLRFSPDPTKTSIFDHCPDSPPDQPRESLILQDENGRALPAIDETSSDPDSEAEAISSARKWIVAALRNWSFDLFCYSPTLYEPSVTSSRTLPASLRIGRQPPSSDASSYDSELRKRPTRGSYSWVHVPCKRTDSSTPGSETETEEYLERLPPARLARFYREDISVKKKLSGPENYFSWTHEMQAKLSQCHAWQMIEREMEPVPTHSRFHTRWKQLNDQAWLLIIANVSREIRRDLCESWRWDTRGTWCYLQESCGGVVATTARSVQGVRELLCLQYEACASMGEFRGKIELCIQAIGCNRREKDGNEWLWSQVILAKLGPKWESWVSDYMKRVKDDDSSLTLLGDVDRLLRALEAEEARRARALRYLEGA